MSDAQDTRKYAMIRCYLNGDREIDTYNLTWKETLDEIRFPLGYLVDKNGTRFRYITILQECWRRRNIL